MKEEEKYRMEQYEKLEMEVIVFENEDVITSSDTLMEPIG